MPVRTYSGIDLINYLVVDSSTHGSNNGTSNATVSEVSQGVVNGIGFANDSGIDGNAFVNIQYVMSGDFDFDAFPSIPDNALITSIRVKVNNSSSGVGSATSTGGGDLQAVASAQNVVELPVGDILMDLLVNVTDGPNVSPSPSASAVSSITFSTEQELLVAPIDKTALVAGFSNIAITMLAGASFGVITPPIDTSASSADSVANLNNFQVIITYESGPEIQLTPSGGNAEPGQSITVTSDVVILGQASYAALQGNKVIPLVPKITPDGVILEIPSPATPDCFNCFAECPECEACLDACTDDLDSDTCQECMENCFDCLVNCLESEEFAEACHQSTGEPPGEIPITIVCSFPPNFEGTVPLGNFNILIANATGIYRLVNGKTNDTLYSSARDGTTYDVKIPNPFGKTGPFRS